VAREAWNRLREVGRACARDGGKIALIAAMTLGTLSLHYMLFPFPHWIHGLHRRLCYLPILLGGLWFGLRGGLTVSVLISAAVIPLALRQSAPFWDNQDLIEIAFYLSLGILTGFLVDRREAERARRERLQASLAESRRLAALGQMAAGIAHEIRTPLGSIQGAAEILAEDFPHGHPRKPFHGILLQETRRLGAVVQDFLDLGRPISLEMAPVEAGHALQACVESLHALGRERGVALKTGAPRRCMVQADAHRLHQALTNIVRNAVQVSPGGACVEVTVTPSDGGCLFVVEDRGPGLAPGDETSVFEPFFTRRKDGTGLGLALVSQIASAHGGWVRAANREGGGARFELWLPSARGAREEGSHAAHPPR
jgi:two-component system sensor histidine kinase HydH